jgi:pyruvate ferredoxin oxidoreductase delta subunit
LVKSEAELTWKELNPGAIVTEPGNASQYQTGDWRSQRPTYEFSRCIKCGVCYIFCPEGCIGQTISGCFESDLFYCKGCGICAEECPTGVITMKEEKEETV